MVRRARLLWGDFNQVVLGDGHPKQNISTVAEAKSVLSTECHTRLDHHFVLIDFQVSSSDLQFSVFIEYITKGKHIF